MISLAKGGNVLYVHQLVRGTEFTAIFDDQTEIDAIFDGNIDHLKFHVICPEFLRNLDKYKETTPTIRILIGEVYYTFTAKILGKSERNEALLETLDFIAISPFKEEQRRNDFRIQIALKVKIHAYDDDYRKLYSGGWLCDSVSDDVSKNGIRLWADHTLPDELGTMYTLEFSLKTGWIYLVPAKLVRHGRNTATLSYKYDYGFIFDFTHMPDKKEKLLMDILEHKIRKGL